MQSSPAKRWRRMGGFATRSLLVRLALLVVVFAVVPILVYDRFKEADEQRRELLLSAIRLRGETVAAAIAPLLIGGSLPLEMLQDELNRYAQPTDSLKLLFQPSGTTAGTAESGFFYIASVPPVPPEALEPERQLLIEAGLLQRLSESCSGAFPLAIQANVGNGKAELVTSLSPVRTTKGCFVLIAASLLGEDAAQRLTMPYWRLPEVQLAMAVYLLVAVIAIVLLLDLWNSLRRFSRLAMDVARARATGGFAAGNRVPELKPVALAFDRMVDTLRDAARSLHDAAEENAHAYKTPMATIRQATTQLRRRVDEEDERGQRALSVIDASLDRLEDLVTAARQIDRGMAELLDPPTDRVDLVPLLRAISDGIRRTLPSGGAQLLFDLGPGTARGIAIRGSANLIETAVENLIENAVSFSPPDGVVTVRLAIDGRDALVEVSDQGTGVASEDLHKIFDRYYSKRDHDTRPYGAGNFGLGLWIVKRNIEALGGQVSARNRPNSGLAVSLRLPRLS
ncbi:sensor histidine kinase [Lacibacterium aquatile]|uniref:histidine kinase n=1 Tax=Lacibacterium aquatile TaxID=1168082 RepID=A0ABW5DPJ0_9PROT